MSRNFSLLQIVGKEEEYFQTETESPAPDLAAASVAVAEAAVAEAAVAEAVVAEAVVAEPAVASPGGANLAVVNLAVVNLAVVNPGSVSAPQHHEPFLVESVGQQPLRFELEAWQLEELNKLVQGVFLAPGSEANRTVVLASTESGNGCSWICARAGELLASQVTGRVCLVDANFGRPTLHEHFGVGNHFGLSDALRQEGSIGGYVSQLSRRNLALVSAGQAISPDLAGSGVMDQGLSGVDLEDRSLACSEAMRQRWQELRRNFDYVLVDGTSLDVGDDAIALGRVADGVVLVLKTHSSRKERTRRRVQDLKSAEVRILGAVLNQPAC
ncbi:MAG TPA: CpsD/CapB family tyrosine-protein kinase [Candidatus Sulfotelmatobacter sp.]|nr:CpsD/CapB family tyrosine-protein kinase [Candidatus Sulfotelmatobacter sp.]